jgi:hypothetical protein
MLACLNIITKGEVAMRIHRWLPLLLACLLTLGGCTRDSELQLLEKSVKQLQDNLEAKRIPAVLEQLHGDFRAQQDLDRQWAQRTMALLFLRHQQVRVIALSQRSQLDPTYPGRGQTRAEVALTGAEGLLPDSARHYRVTLEWWREGDHWQLARLDWE